MYRDIPRQCQLNQFTCILNPRISRDVDDEKASQSSFNNGKGMRQHHARRQDVPFADIDFMAMYFIQRCQNVAAPVKVREQRTWPSSLHFQHVQTC